MKVIPTKSKSTSAPAVDVETAVSTPSPSTAKDSESAKSEVAMSAQNGRARVICAECTKPRVVYCNKKLDIRHKMMLARCLSSFDYTCGSHLFSPNDKRKLALSVYLAQVYSPYKSHQPAKGLCAASVFDMSLHGSKMVK